MQLILRFMFFCLGMAQFVSKFAEPGEPEYSPPVPVVETPVMFCSFDTNYAGIISFNCVKHSFVTECFFFVGHVCGGFI